VDESLEADTKFYVVGNVFFFSFHWPPDEKHARKG
jgi:hypothetical protein